MAEPFTMADPRPLLFPLLVKILLVSSVKEKYLVAVTKYLTRKRFLLRQK